MADPLSITSGVLALVTFAFQSSQFLYQTVASFQSSQRNVRELKEELKALEEVLGSLLETATDTDADFATLKLPLLRCGKACNDFKAVIAKCTAHSDGSRKSFRDWARLQYMDSDIVGFKNMLAGYKSTIVIALGDANIRKSVVTIGVLKEYKEIITNTTSDLEDHLQDIDQKLQKLSLQGEGISAEDAAERQQMQEERDSTQQCLGICAKVFAHINEFQPNAIERTSIPLVGSQEPSVTLTGVVSARQTTHDTFMACKEKISSTTAQLEKQLKDIDTRLGKFSLQPPIQSNEQAAELERMKEELESVKQCLAICSEASKQADKERSNEYEDISVKDDGQQVVVSTIGELISAKRITAGDRSFQWFGQMSDESLQQLSRDRVGITRAKPQQQQTGSDAQFEDRYGAGVKLHSLNLNDAGSVNK